MKAKAVRFLVIAMMMAFVQLMVVSTSLAAAPNNQQGWDGGNYHTVRYGETLFSIGRMHGVYPYAIAQANGLWNPDYIFAGQVLYIPEGADWNGGGCNSGCDTGWNDGCNSDCDSGWDNSGCNTGCDSGWDNSGCDTGCDTDWNNGCDTGCDTGWDNSGCDTGCDNGNWNMQYGNNHPYNYGYGYDNTGYYYNNYNGGEYNQYSYACGYYYNCY